MPKLSKVPKMPKVKVFCLFKMIGIQNFSSFVTLKYSNSIKVDIIFWQRRH